MNAELHVFTFKEGLLSAVAHDLQLRVTRFSIEREAAGGVVVSVEAASLEVVTAMKSGRPDPAALSAAQKREIEGNLRAEVLVTSRHPKIVFRSTTIRALPCPRRWAR